MLQTVAVVISILTGALIIGEKVSKPFRDMKKSVDKLNLTIQTLSDDLEDSKNDRKGIHVELNEHDHRLDAHDVKLEKHEERIRTLFERGKSE